MSCCKTKIIQLAGGALGGGPYTVAPNTPAPGQTTVTDTSSSNTFIVPDASLYNFDGTLSGPRVINSAGNDLTFNGGGDFIIDGKLTVTGIIDPTGLQFTNNVNQPDASMPNTTIYVTDGSLSGIPAGEIVFKDGAGNYHQLENSASGSILTADFVQTANRTQNFGTWAQNWNQMGQWTINYPEGFKNQNFTSIFVPDTLVSQQNAGGMNLTHTDGFGYQGKLQVNGASTRLTLNDAGTNDVGFILQNGGVGPALGVPQTHIKTLNVDLGTAIVGQVLALSALTGEVEFITPAGANYANANLTATGTRTHTWGANTQLETFTTGGASRTYNNGSTSLQITEGGGGLLTKAVNGLDEFVSQTYPSFVIMTAFTPAKGAASVRVDNSSIYLTFGTNRDLQVAGSAGTVGQVLTSNGPGVPPAWSPAPASPQSARWTASRGATFGATIGTAITVAAGNPTWNTLLGAGFAIPSWPGGGFVSGAGLGITMSAGATPLTLVGSGTAAYRITANIAVSHSVAGLVVWGQLVNSTTGAIIDVAITSGGSVNCLVFDAIVTPSAASESYDIRLCSNSTGTINIHKLSIGATRLSA